MSIWLHILVGLKVINEMRLRITHLLQVGGTPAVVHYLLEQGLLDGDCITGRYSQQLFIKSYLEVLGNNTVFPFALSVTGKTLAENAKIFPPLSEGQVKINHEFFSFTSETFL
jgi:hypothetical protein